jgi:hypothetical protein
METSAKTGINTQELFVEAAKILYNDYIQYKNNKPQIPSDIINLNNTEASKAQIKKNVVVNK